MAASNHSKRTVLFGLSGIVLIVGVVIIYLILNRNATPGYFDDNPWGTSYGEIERKYGSDIRKSTVSLGSLELTQESFHSVEQVFVYTLFSFDEQNKLNEITVSITREDREMSPSELYDQVVDTLIESYGEPKDTVNGLLWNTKESIIDITQLSDVPYRITITYHPRN